MVGADDDGTEVGNPGLVAGWVARDIKSKTRPVGPHHQGHQLVRHAASHVRGDEIAGERIAYGNALLQARAGRIEDLPLEDRPAENIRADLSAGEQSAEVTLLEGIDRSRVAEAGEDTGTEFKPVEVDEEERLVAAIVYLGDEHGAAHRQAERIASLL